MGIVAREIGKKAGRVAVCPTHLVRQGLLHGSGGSLPEQKRAFCQLSVGHAVLVSIPRFRCLIDFAHPRPAKAREGRRPRSVARSRSRGDVLANWPALDRVPYNRIGELTAALSSDQ